MNLNLKSNAFWAALETVISGVALFVLYKYVLIFVGLTGLGLWSLVLATTSLARFGDIGAAAGLARFVALARARKDEKLAAAYTDTAFLSNLVLYGVFAGMFYVPAWHGLAWVTPSEQLDEGRALLPYAIASFVLLNLNSVTLSALVGAQRSDLKSKVMIASLVVQISTVSLCIRPFGLEAMAWAQIAQNLFAMLAGRVVACRLLTELPLLPGRFSRPAFRELLGLGMRMQASTLIAFIFEPLTKFTISATSGLATLGLFEMAYRMVLQVRHVVVTPMQTLVPAFAHLAEVEPKALPDLYARSLAQAIVAGAVLLLVPILAAPFVSHFWLGRLDPHFVLFTALCCLGWYGNLVGTPAYLIGISRGYLRGNIIGHAITSFGGPAAALAAFHLMRTEWLSVALPNAGLAAGALVSASINSAMFCLPLPSRAAFAQAARDLSAAFGRRRQETDTTSNP